MNGLTVTCQVEMISHGISWLHGFPPPPQDNRNVFLEAELLILILCKLQYWKKKSAQFKKLFSQTSFGFIPSSVYKMVDSKLKLTISNGNVPKIM